MSPRRQDSDETLLDESSNVGYDKLDGTLPFVFVFDKTGGGSLIYMTSTTSSEGVPLDPFLVVQPSLNDSVLVKQGLVEEMTLPPPTHRAYDVQV
jgi:hypothetical protein